ncbi:hypothetical protein RCL_jg15772.t1 [Rhizophagus clarus]|uniref:Uncharacterized protein n=1 Tax=Rhizophagus clarus TaxID=94130 RepID=A0A8H3R6Y2_9GLOM|nr:hypothetical protein RCL_jg15772.t1 [Rhizophagus clarus]
MTSDPKALYFGQKLVELLIALRASEYAYRSHLEKYHGCQDFFYSTETDTSRSTTPTQQQDFNISDISEKQESIIDLEPFCMITEDIPKISTSSSKAHADPLL